MRRFGPRRATTMGWLRRWMAMTPSVQPPDASAVDRRDFLYIATAALAGAGAVATLWPLIDQMNPAADVIAAGAPITIDISELTPGQQLTVIWRSRPIFIARRTPQNIEDLKDPQLLNNLADPDSDEPQQPDYAKKLVALGEAGISSAGRDLHASWLYPEFPAGLGYPDLEWRRLSVPVPWLQIRHCRPGLQRRSGTLQPACAALSFR